MRRIFKWHLNFVFVDKQFIGEFKMKNKIGFISLFVAQGLGIPFSLFAGLMLMFSVVSLVETDWLRMKVAVQSVVALISMVIGIAYIGTYMFSLTKTMKNKKLSFVSWLPFLHGIVALLALVLWNYVNKIYK